MNSSRDSSVPRSSPSAKVAPLRDLRAGWDTYDAPAIDERALEAAALFLVEVERRWSGRTNDRGFHLAPSREGGVAIEWKVSSKDLSVYILANGQILIGRSDDGDDADDRETSVDGAVGDVAWLFA